MIIITGAFYGSGLPQVNLLEGGGTIEVENRQELEKLRKRLEIKHGCKNIVFIYKEMKKED